MGKLERAVPGRDLDALPRDLDAAVADCAREAQFAAGQYLLRAGAPADTFYRIADGRVALEAHAPARPPQILMTLGAGEFVGLSWLVPPYRWAYDARASEAVRAVAIDARCIRAKCDADPRLGYALATFFLGVSLRRLQAMRLQHLDMYGAARG